MTHSGTRGALAATVGALLLTSCSSTPTTTSTPPASAATTSGTTMTHTTTFGDTITYPDGLTLTVSTPQRFTPTPDAFTTSKATVFIRVQITLTNDTKLIIQTKPLTRSMTSAGTDITTDDVYDAPAGTWPDAPVLPGKHLTWVKAWGVPDPTSLQLTMTLPGHPQTIFTTA